MKKLIYVVATMIFLVITISMVTKNHINTPKKNTAGLSIRNDILVEERQ